MRIGQRLMIEHRCGRAKTRPEPLALEQRYTMRLRWAARRVRVVRSPLLGEGQGGGCPPTADPASDAV